MGWSEVRLTRLERLLGWSSKFELERRHEFGRRVRRRSRTSYGWVASRRWWHYAYRNGMWAIDDYLVGKTDESPLAWCREFGHLLTVGREIEGARLAFDGFNQLRIAQVVSLIWRRWFERKEQ